MAKDIKSLMKSIRKITESESFSSSKYSEVSEWISTGDYGLNRIISGSIYRGIPAGRVVLIGGESQCTPRNQRVTILYRHYFKDPIPKSLLPLNLSINKEIITRENVINATIKLNEICYTGNDIFKGAGISSRTYNRCLRQEDVKTNSKTLNKIYSFYLSRIFSIEIGDLENLDSRDYFISTPDGWQRTGTFFKKGELKCYNITTENNKSLIASEKHLIQLSNGEWKPVHLLTTDDIVDTIDGNSKIISNTELSYPIECVDIEVLHENHRYYCEGISSHNSGKSFVAAQCAANALNELNYDMIFYFDSEGGAMKQFFESRGCDPDKIEQVLVSSIEDATIKILAAYTQIEEYKKENPELKCLFILDSLGALVTNKFVNDASSGKVVSDMGLRAKLCNNLIKGVTIPALRSNTTLIVTNHIYSDPSSLFSSKLMNQSGGKGLQYMARITLQCSKTFEKEDAPEKENTGYYKSTTLKFFTAKNSIVKPFFTSHMLLDFSKGPHKYFGLFEPACQLGFITKPTQGFYGVPSYSDKKFRLKELLTCNEAWESFLPEFDKKSLELMSYGSAQEQSELNDDLLSDIEQQFDSSETATT